MWPASDCSPCFVYLVFVAWCYLLGLWWQNLIPALWLFGQFEETTCSDTLSDRFFADFWIKEDELDLFPVFSRSLWAIEINPRKRWTIQQSPSCSCFGFDSFDFCGFRILLGLLFKGDPCFIVDETGTKRQFPSRVWRNGEVADGGTERSVRGSWRGVGVSGHDQARQTKKPISSWLLN